jgi:hypothetical protein
MWQILGHHFLYHAAHRSFNVVHHADLVLAHPVPAPCRPPTFQPRARRRPAPIWPGIGCINHAVFRLLNRRAQGRPAPIWPGMCSYTTPGINPSIPKRTATHRLADPPGVCHRACPRQPRQSLRAGVKTRRPAQVSTLPTKIACREPALPMLSGNPVLPGSLAVSRPRTAEDRQPASTTHRPTKISCRKPAPDSPTTLRWQTQLCMDMRSSNQERLA